MYSMSMIIVCIAYYYISFTSLLSKPIRLPYSACLIGLYFLLTLFSPLSGQWNTFPFVFCTIILIYFATGRQLLEVILSCIGCFFAIAIHHFCLIPLSFSGILFDSVQSDFALPFTILTLILTTFFLFIIKRVFIIPKLYLLQSCPYKSQWLFLLQILLCITVMAVNFIYNELSGYPTHILLFNGILIFISALIILLLFTNLLYLLQTNHDLTLKQEEQNLLYDYTQHMESFYDELRAFRHDYKNILSTMQYYIDSNDIAALKQYLNDIILPYNNILSADGFTIGKLRFLQVPAIKSLIYLKIVSALNNGLQVTLELTDYITKIDMNELDLSRILGILLDNASEAALLTEEKLLKIAIVSTESSVLFSIINSTPPIAVPLSRLSEKGYTSKKQHEGIGLYQVDNIIRPLNNVFYKVDYNELFKQTLEIKTREDL